MADWNANIIEEFRQNEGQVGDFFEGATILLLHTKGRKTGKEHVTPLVYLPDGDRWVVFGSMGGAPSDPDWVRNLEADPDATIEVGTGTVPARAVKILRNEPEREDLYSRQVARRQGFAEYEVKTEGIRKIPAVVLARREE
ncbi:MAG: nitroreductase family deazaflavin-dependent oxidoreductase [Actinobacteria bacterium]|nr:nitroreductase family deazaflavin-dependent oxidoreductase [Actinomycetota bacterium]